MNYRIDHWGWGHWTGRPITDEWFVWALTERGVLRKLDRRIKRQKRYDAERRTIYKQDAAS